MCNGLKDQLVMRPTHNRCWPFVPSVSLSNETLCYFNKETRDLF